MLVYFPRRKIPPGRFQPESARTNSEESTFSSADHWFPLIGGWILHSTI